VGTQWRVNIQQHIQQLRLAAQESDGMEGDILHIVLESWDSTVTNFGTNV